jgi:hypothetical protein
MGFHATSDYDPDAPLSDEAQADAEHDRLLRDYLAAREALKRITPTMDRDTVWAIKDRFVKAQLAMDVQRDAEAYHAINQQAMRGLPGAA